MKNGTFKYALVKSVPVLFGYLFLGSAFGIMIAQAGYNALWAFFCSLFIYAGSGEFLLVSLLVAVEPLYTCAVMTFLVNSRHIFYGLTFIDKFRSTGKFYPYMIFSLTDETYSVLCSTKYPPHVDEKKCMFYITLLHHTYWIAGSVIGAVAGQLIPFDFKGVDFSMTALFVVIFIEQWKSSTTHIPAYCGIGCALGCLLIFGADNFILPSLILTVTLLLFLRKPLDNGAKEEIQADEVVKAEKIGEIGENSEERGDLQ